MTLGNLVKPVFIASILVFSVVGLGLILQDASAEHGEDPGITKTVIAGAKTLDWFFHFYCKLFVSWLVFT